MHKIELLSLNMKKSLLFIISLGMLVACKGNMDYDISEGINKDITLFEDEITLPIGSIGPITIGSTLNAESKMDGIIGMLTNYIKTAPDGRMILEDTGSIFKINVYELEKEAGDVSAPFKWQPGYASASIGGMASMLGMAGLKPIGQSFEVSVSNPLYENVPVTSTAYYTCYNNQYEVVYKGSLEPLNSFTLPYATVGKNLLTEEVPESVDGKVSSITMDDLTLELPATPTSIISDKKGNLFFDISYKYSCGIAVGDSFNLPFSDLTIKSVKLPVEKFRVADCLVHVVLENTLPFNVFVGNFRALTRNNPESEEPTEDFNILITTDIDIAGGSIENPAQSTVDLSIKTLQGTIPDIEGLKFDLQASSQYGLEPVPLSAKQGLYVKSAYATLKGGVTITQE